MTTNRPHIICHMMTSLDGKITFGTVQGKSTDVSVFWDHMDLYNLTHRKLEAKAWMCGRVTMDEFNSDAKESLDSYTNLDGTDEEYIVKSELGNYAIGIDTKGLLRWKENFVHIGGEKIDENKHSLVMVVTKNTPKEYLSYLRSKNISYIFGGETDVNFEDTFVQLKEKFGIERILLEGGGSINGSVIKAGLVDELSILLLPIVVNNVEAPSLFYSDLTEAMVHNFKLMSTEKLDRNVVWLRYIMK